FCSTAAAPLPATTTADTTAATFPAVRAAAPPATKPPPATSPPPTRPPPVSRPVAVASPPPAATPPPAARPLPPAAHPLPAAAPGGEGQVFAGVHAGGVAGLGGLHQADPGPNQQRLHRRDRDLERVGQVGVGEALHLAHQQHRALLGGKAPDVGHQAAQVLAPL